MSKKITTQGKGFPTLLTLIVLKKTGMFEHFIIFDMTQLFIYTKISFRCMKGTRTKEGFPHFLHPLGLPCLHFFDE
jgi:hypothetical protein